MDALNVLLIVGAVLLALFTFIFSAGSLIHLSSLINEAVRVTTGLMPRWMKTAVVVLGVVAVGLVAIAASDHRTLSLHAIAAPVAQAVEGATGAAASVSGSLPAAEDRFSR